MNAAAVRSPVIPCGIARTASRVQIRKVARFADDGNLRYYASPVPSCKMKTKDEKKKTRDLFALRSRSSLMEATPVQAEEKEAAAEILLEQVRLRRAEKKEMRKMKKEEKKAAKAAKKRKGSAEGKSSSSSSSDSSDNEHEKSRFKMSRLRTKAVLMAPRPKVQSPPLESLGIAGPASGRQQNEAPIDITMVMEQLERHSVSATATAAAKKMNKIEVCMGGKCKKSGAPELLAEFERQVGVDGAVVVRRCKCMGRCKEGPNVRVVSDRTTTADGGAPLIKNPLCIGVGLQDVGNIVSELAV